VERFKVSGLMEREIDDMRIGLKPSIGFEIKEGEES
jgi:hypothetical protein